MSAVFSFPPGIVIAAPASASGKTVFTLGLLRHLARGGHRVASAKAGPDYIDPAFHARSGGGVCLTLDAWAMSPARLSHMASAHANGRPLVCEGVMGLFDGAASGEGATADLAALAGWPVVLVMDAANQGASAAATLSGFVRFRADVSVAGVVFNRVGSARHERILRDAVAAAQPGVAVLGAIPRIGGLALPSRHLGLVQAVEHPDLDGFMDRAADLVAEHVDVARLLALAGAHGAAKAAPAPVSPAVSPLGARIAVARDEAFAFAYDHVLSGWRGAGAELSFFSPLAGEGPGADADAVYLPGGYPELHAGRLSAAGFLPALRDAAARGAVVWGECGGYMALGRALVDAEGHAHEMAGLLPLETSFRDRRLHLGYRRGVLAADGPLGRKGAVFRGHEFHYASVTAETGVASLFDLSDAEGRALGPAGLRAGSVMGSFLHLIAAEDA